MSPTPRLLRPVRAVAHLARTWPYLGRTAFAIGLVVMLLAWTQGHHLDHPAEVVGYEVENGKLIAQAGVAPAGPLLKAVSLALPYLDRWMLVGGVVYVFILLRQWGNPRKLILPTTVAALSVAGWAVATDMAQQLGGMQMTEMGEPPVMAAYWVKLGMIVLACVSVPAMLGSYLRGLTLERYVMRLFLGPLVFCFVGFASLWIVMDLLDNLKDFQQSRTPLGRILLFYLGAIPHIFVLVMPVSVLLAVIYTLMRLSRSNELVAMHTAGRGLGQILRPVFVIVIGVSVLSLTANYYWAPRAEGIRNAMVRALGAGQSDSIMASALLYRDARSNRMWFISSFPFSLRGGRERMRGVMVQEEDASGRLLREIHADSAMWWQGGIWRFFDGKEVLYEEGKAVRVKPFPVGATGRSVLDVRRYEETPWAMVSDSLQPDFMGVPEIVSYLKAHGREAAEKQAPFLTHLFQRFALPWQSLVLALVAAPLGIAYSRRGAVGGITGSIFVYFGMLFLNNLFLNLGKGGHVPAGLSPFIPYLLLGCGGLLLLHFKSLNRELPRLSLPWAGRPSERKAPAAKANQRAG